MKIIDIKVGNRFRKDLGDIKTLVNSIQEIGLLQPVVVNENNELIAGQRRIEAVRMLGWSEIPAVVVNLDDIVKGELHENIVRQDFTFTERQAILKEVEKKRIGHRMSGEKVDNLSTFQQENKGISSAEIVARYTGKSPTQIKKEKKIFETLENNPKLNYLVEQLDTEDVTVNLAYEIIREVEEVESYDEYFDRRFESLIRRTKNEDLEKKIRKHIVEQANRVHDGIFCHDYGVGWSWPDGTIHCILCDIDKAFPEDYTTKDTVIPLICTNREWSLHFLHYHAETGRPGNVWEKYEPYLMKW